MIKTKSTQCGANQQIFTKLKIFIKIKTIHLANMVIKNKVISKTHTKNKVNSIIGNKIIKQKLLIKSISTIIITIGNLPQIK
jgi:hypothetical protein